MRKLSDLEIQMLISRGALICPICGDTSSLTAKPLSGEGSFVGYCADCIAEAEAVGVGESEDEAIQDYVEKNLP